jgi:hypothetical protein
VVPDLFHIIPVGDNTMLNGVLQGEDTTFGLGLITDICISLFHTNHDTRLAGTSNQGRKHRSWGIISSKTGCKEINVRVEKEKKQEKNLCQ